MLLINRYFEGNLPFTGIIREVYGLPYATSTDVREQIVLILA